MDVTVVPMDTDRVLPHQTVLVQGTRITALGPVAQVPVPAGAVRVDGRGKYLIPGLADMHAHVLASGVPDGGAMRDPAQDAMTVPSRPAEGLSDSAHTVVRLLLWVTNGATTIRDMDHQVAGTAIIRWRAGVTAGEVIGPRMYVSGSWAGREDSWPAPAEVNKYLAAYKAAGFDFVKPYFEPPGVFDSVATAARRLGLPLAGHVPSGVRDRVIEQVLPAYKSIEHTMEQWDRSLVHKLVPATGLDTSLVIDDPSSSISMTHPDTARLRALAAAMHRYGVWNCPTKALENGEPAHTAPGNGVVKGLQEGGVGLLLGTDKVPRPGVLTHELQALVREGLTPYQALLTGTRNVAVYFGTLDSTGTIAVGKRADLVLLSGNPLEDVKFTANPAGVMLNGRWLTQEFLQQQLARYPGAPEALPEQDPAAGP